MSERYNFPKGERKERGRNREKQRDGRREGRWEGKEKKRKKHGEIRKLEMIHRLKNNGKEGRRSCDGSLPCSPHLRATCYVLSTSATKFPG